MSRAFVVSLSACVPVTTGSTAASPAAAAAAATAPAAASPAAEARALGTPAAAAPKPAAAQPCTQPLPPAPPEACKGQLSNTPHGFLAIDAPDLIARAKRGPGLGGVCDARAFEVTGTPVIYRAYNGTNPGSRLGEWWALEEPSGSVAAYRQDYQICYQWSPLDRLVKCTLRAGSRVVLGTGQSAVCSEHLSYAPSASVQLYIADAAASVMECAEFDAMLSWEPAAPKAPQTVSPPTNAVSSRE